MSYTKSVETVGGLAKLWVLPLQNFDGLLYNKEQNLFGLQSAKNYLQPLYFTPDTGGYKVQWKKNGYQVSIKAVIPGNDDAIDEMLLFLETNPFLLVGQNHNGQYVFFGDHQNFFIYNREQDTGSDFADLSNFSFELTRLMLVKPLFIASPFVFYPPTVSELEIVGNLTPRSYASLVYTFTDPQNMSENGSIYKWFVADNAQGTNRQQIAGQSAAKYLIPDSQALKYLQASITPFNGKAYGEEVLSDYKLIAQLPNEMPVASNVELIGDYHPGFNLQANYNYSHEMNIPESGTIYKFYASDDAQGANKQELYNGTLNRYTVKQSDIGKFLSVVVVPSDGVKYGDEVSSAYHLIEAGVPVASNVSISGTIRINNAVSAAYSYTDPYGSQESGSQINWYVADNAAGLNRSKVGEGSIYHISEVLENKYLQLEVIPSNGHQTGVAKTSVYYQILGNIILLPQTNNIQLWMNHYEKIEAGIDYFTIRALDEGGAVWANAFSIDSFGAKLPAGTEIYFEAEYKVSNPVDFKLWPGNPVHIQSIGTYQFSSVGKRGSDIQLGIIQGSDWHTFKGWVRGSSEFETVRLVMESAPINTLIEFRNIKIFYKV